MLSAVPLTQFGPSRLEAAKSPGAVGGFCQDIGRGVEEGALQVKDVAEQALAKAGLQKS